MFSGSISSIKTIRTIRLLRVFRILKLIRYVKEANTLKQALIASRQRIVVFLLAVLAVATIMGTIIYIIEDPEDGFTIPQIILINVVLPAPRKPVTTVAGIFAGMRIL